MARKRYSDEDVLKLLREIDVHWHDGLDALHPLFMKHGKPEFIRFDNGHEFISMHLQDWLKRIGIKPMQIYPDSPWECGGIKKQCGTLFFRHMIQRTL